MLTPLLSLSSGAVCHHVSVEQRWRPGSDHNHHRRMLWRRGLADPTGGARLVPQVGVDVYMSENISWDPQSP